MGKTDNIDYSGDNIKPVRKTDISIIVRSLQWLMIFHNMGISSTFRMKQVTLSLIHKGRNTGGLHANN